jgi:hypothetical protein
MNFCDSKPTNVSEQSSNIVNEPEEEEDIPF